MKTTAYLIVICFLLWAGKVYADGAQIKLYKEAYPDAKPKCVMCHAEALPKKDSHELNAYGQAVKGAEKELTVESYKKIGPAEDFKGSTEEKK